MSEQQQTITGWGVATMIFAPLAIGVSIGSCVHETWICPQERVRAQAVKHGAAHWIDDGEGEAKFEWITPEVKQ